MAQPNLQSFKRRGFAIKAESSEGIDSVPTSSANAFRLFDGSSSIEGDVIERPVDSDIFGHDPFVVGNQRVIVEGDLELIPPTTPGDAVDGKIAARHVLFPCGMAETLTSTDDLTEYRCISDAIPSASVYFWHSGTKRVGLGTRGDISGLMMAIGDRFKARCRMQGSYSSITEAVLPTFDYSAFTVPTVSRKDNSIMRAATLTGAMVHLRAKSLSVDFNNGLATKEYTQFGTTTINERKPLATLRFARPAMADINFHALRDAGTFIKADYTVVETNGNYSRLFVQGQIENITDTDIDGDFGYEVTVRCIPTSAGGDEVIVEFGTTTVQLLGDLPDGTDDVAYSEQLRFRGVSYAPVVYSVFSGTLPTGLTLNTATGVVSGTPTTAGPYTFVLRVTYTNSAGATATADSVSQAVTIA
jgi:hypothetical protein